METLLLSQDFYSPASTATRIKPPVELLISTYKKMELKAVPGIPDFNEQTEMLGQKLFYPPNVAGWAHGRSWITPGLLLARGNVIYDIAFGAIQSAPKLATAISAVPGVVEHGLFIDICGIVLVGTDSGVKTLKKPPRPGS